MKYKYLIPALLLMGIALFAVSSCKDINTNYDPRFEKDGTFVSDYEDTIDFAPEPPQRVKFYVEVSGSMNGFFRPNCPTEFKADVWQVLSYYSSLIPEVAILTNDGNMGTTVSRKSFQTMMNTGAFISSASTKVPVMLQTILDNLNTDEGEVAVLVSDMKYSPVGSAAPEVLMTEYSTDISEIFGKSQKAVCLVCATSDYLDKTGKTMCDKSPYYFLIIGNDRQVAEMRNGISTLLDNNGHFVDNIESGFTYGAPNYSFGIPDNCIQMDNVNPTFCDFDPSENDTCTIKLKVNLENYRWLIANQQYIDSAFKAKALYGSNVKVDNIKLEIKNITQQDLKRKATAIVDLKIFDLATDSEVIEWTLELPDTDVTLFSPFLGATQESDVTGSYSLDRFIKGMFYGGVVNKPLNNNYILISKNS